MHVPSFLLLRVTSWREGSFVLNKDNISIYIMSDFPTGAGKCRWEGEVGAEEWQPSGKSEALLVLHFPLGALWGFVSFVSCRRNLRGRFPWRGHVSPCCLSLLRLGWMPFLSASLLPWHLRAGEGSHAVPSQHLSGITLPEMAINPQADNGNLASHVVPSPGCIICQGDNSLTLWSGDEPFA